MGFKCGIVGLPNVGKSTLFNALIKTATAQSSNYPFCTIEPNTGEISVPDPRIKKIAKLVGSKKIMPTRIRFVDIAGLVRGASKGEGLGNQFLANIREVNAIVHVLRCFVDDDVAHVEGRIDPVSDAVTVETELMLSDMESLEKQIVQIRKRVIARDKEAIATLPIMEKVLGFLQAGNPARLLLGDISMEERIILDAFNLLTSKPVLYVCNVAENDASTGNKFTEAIATMAAEQSTGIVVISAEIEAELAQLPDNEVVEYLKFMGLHESGLDRLIRSGYRLLNLITFFTCGPKETRAWTIKRGTKAPQAAGVIHSDFERGFIRAQTVSYKDYISLGGEVAAREAGKARDEGKEYIVQDGDIMFFKHNT
ncbi:MAG: Ribosome-binding ATPase YchF [Candidatus Tokpelaia sp. JSC188]|nr:MAG: Ribosome-binding ATPase YchF [Candidatus Tokpelaia sp. JSC188]